MKKNFRVLMDSCGDKVVINLAQVVDIYEESTEIVAIELSNGKRVTVRNNLEDIAFEFNRDY